MRILREMGLVTPQTWKGFRTRSKAVTDASYASVIQMAGELEDQLHNLTPQNAAPDQMDVFHTLWAKHICKQCDRRDIIVQHLTSAYHRYDRKGNVRSLHGWKPR